MATEKQAQQAAEELRATVESQGAFAIDVRKVPRGTGFAVYVYFEQAPVPPLQATRTVSDRGKTVSVPVRVVVGDAFVPE